MADLGARDARVLLSEIPKLNSEDIWKALYDSLVPLKGPLVKCRHSLQVVRCSQ